MIYEKGCIRNENCICRGCQRRKKRIARDIRMKIDPDKEWELIQQERNKTGKCKCGMDVFVFNDYDLVCSKCDFRPKGTY